MATVTRYASSYVSGNAWTNPGNAYADDNNYVTAAPAKNSTISGQWNGFGFDSMIPDGSIINSVTVEFGYYVSTTSSIATAGSQLYTGGVAKGTEYTDTAEPTAEVTRSYSVSGLTRSDLLDANLAIQVRATRGNSNTAVTFYLDFVRVTVNYTPVVTGATSLLTTSTTDAAGLRTALGTAALSATSAVSAAGALIGAILGSAQLATVSSVAAVGSRLTSGAASLVTSSTAAASGVRLVHGVAMITASSAASAIGLAIRLAVSSLGAVTTLSASAGKLLFGTASVVTQSIVSAVSLRLTTGVAGIIAVSDVTTMAVRVVSEATQIAASSVTSTRALLVRLGATSVSTASSLGVVGELITEAITGAAQIAVPSAVQAVVSCLRVGATAVNSTSSLSTVAQLVARALGRNLQGVTVHIEQTHGSVTLTQLPRPSATVKVTRHSTTVEV